MTRSIDLIDALNFAIELETEGQAFYKACRSFVNDQSVKELLAFLADQEAQHKSQFEEMLERVKDKDVCLSQDHVAGLMKAYANSFFESEESVIGTLTDTISQGDVVDYGIQIEKDSIAYYQTLKASLPEGCKSDMDRIINTEKEHLAKFQELKDKLSSY